MSELRTSDAGLKLIKAYEGFRPDSRQLADGRWVIGFGHTKAAREGLTITEAEAEAILSEFDLPPIEEALNNLLLVPVSQNEFDALVSFAFNIGLSQFESSDVLAHINAGNKLKAAWAMESWRKARVGQRDMVVDPLVRRRADEKALFLKTEGPVPHASSSHFRPMVDIEETERYRKQVQMAAFQAPGFPANDQIDEEISTEAAARHVKDRLTRILGEEEANEILAEHHDDDFDAPTENDEKSVDDIRAAVSALAIDTAPKGDLAGNLEAEAAIDEAALVEADIEAEEEAEPEAEEQPEPQAAEEETASEHAFTMSADNDVDELAADEDADEEAETPVVEAEEHEEPSPFDLLVPPGHQKPAQQDTAEHEQVVDAEIAETVADADDETTAEAVSDDTSDSSEDVKELEADDDFEVELEPLVAEQVDPDEDEIENRDERGRILIDDLRPSDVWLSEGRDDDEERREGPLETLLFGILALVGAGLFTYGGSAEFGWFGVDQPPQTDMMAYLPPFLMLLGGLIFVVMAYYCIKAIFGGRKEG